MNDSNNIGRVKRWPAYLFAVVATVATLGLRLALNKRFNIHGLPPRRQCRRG